MGAVITAEARIIGRDMTGDMFASLSKKMNSLGKSMKVGADVERLSKSLGQASKHLQAIEAFKDKQNAFVRARDQFRQTQAAVEATARAMKAAEAPTRAMEQAHRNAQRAVSAAAAAYERQREAVIGAKRAIEGMGTPVSRYVADEKRLRAAMEQTSQAIDRRTRIAERRASRREALGTIGAGASVLAAHKAVDIGKKAVVSAAEFDIGVRKQRVFNDLSETDQAPLIAQAKKIGQETPFSNLDVVKAQTTAMQGLPSGFGAKLKAEVAQGILDNVRNYAILMEADLQSSAGAVRSYLQATGKDISTKEKALKEANLATNQLVRMAKLGGMNDEDVQQYMKYAGASGTAGGLSSPTLMALGAAGRRSGLRGDEMGVFIRSMSSKLNSPTKQGLAALNAAGINYSDFVRMPDRLQVDRLEGQFRTDLGKSFTPAVREKLGRVLGDQSLLADRGRFTAAVTDAVAELFPVTKKGGMAAADRRSIAKSAGVFHKTSAASVDSERLLDAIFTSGMTAAQFNAMFTDKHGGKAKLTQQEFDRLKQDREEIKRAGDDPNYAKSRADTIMGGLGGSLENLKGSIDNAVLTIGNAFEGPLKASFDKMGQALDAFSNLSQGTQQVVTVFGALVVAGTGLLGALKLTGAVLGLGKGIAAGAAAGAAGAAAAGGAAAGAAGGVAANGARGTLGAAFGRVWPALASPAMGTLGMVAALPSVIDTFGQQYGYREASGPASKSYSRILRRSLDEQYGGPAMPAAPGGGSGGTVKAEVTGEVTGRVESTLKVEASSTLLAIPEAVKKLDAAVSGALSSVRAALGGSSVSMPHYASPQPSGSK